MRCPNSDTAWRVGRPLGSTGRPARAAASGMLMVYHMAEAARHQAKFPCCAAIGAKPRSRRAQEKARWHRPAPPARSDVIEPEALLRRVQVQYVRRTPRQVVCFGSRGRELYSGLTCAASRTLGEMRQVGQPCIVPGLICNQLVLACSCPAGVFTFIIASSTARALEKSPGPHKARGKYE